MARWPLGFVALFLMGAAPPTPDQPPHEQTKVGPAKPLKPAPTSPTASLQELREPPSVDPRDKRNSGEASGPNWAEAGTFWTGVSQAVIGAFGLVGLFFTVLYARSAWKAAERSATAADKTLKASRAALRHTKETSKRELRAYVFVTNIEATPIAIGASPRITYTITNSGQTPAKDVLVAAEIDMYPRDVDEEHLEPKFRDGISKSPLAPGAAVTGDIEMTRVLSQMGIDAHASGEAMFIAFGRISYVDAFDERRTTDFRFWNRNERGWVASPEGNSYT
jgi:hypothetical protein